MVLAGCDTEKAPQSQGNGAPAAAAAPAGTPRYQIVRERAGTALAETSLFAPGGARRSLSSLQGKPVLLNLWASWCAPCVEELPTLDALAARLEGTAHVIALSQDLGSQNVPDSFLTQRGWTNIQSWHDPDNIVGIAVGGNLPTTVLYGADGREVLRVVGPLDWSGDVATRLLAEAGIGP